MISGPYMGFNDAWNFWANTTTTLGTWLIVILIQHCQNRDTTAINLKLDALIQANAKVSDRLIGIENRDGPA